MGLTEKIESYKANADAAPFQRPAGDKAYVNGFKLTLSVHDHFDDARKIGLNPVESSVVSTLKSRVGETSSALIGGPLNSKCSLIVAV